MDNFNAERVIQSHEKADRATLSGYIKPLFDFFDASVFDGKLAKYSHCVIWRAGLVRSMAKCRVKKRGGGECEVLIRLSPIMVTSGHRLAEALLHEMCHLAVRIIDDDFKDGHGPKFQAWGEKASALFPSIRVKTKTFYGIPMNYFYRCTACHKVLIRTIKRSPKALKKQCKKCKAPLYLTYTDEDIAI